LIFFFNIVILDVIKSFACKDTEKLFRGKNVRRFDPRIITRAIVKLDQLAAAGDINDLRIPPSNHLELLKGNRSGQYSIRINKQWRLCFIWNDGAERVGITDYH